MFLHYTIKEGLHCRIKSTASNQVKHASLYVTPHALTLNCSVNFQGLQSTELDTQSTFDFQFTFHESYLRSFSLPGQVLSVSGFSNENNIPICCNSQMLLHEMLHCKLEGIFRNIYLESKCLLLLICFQNRKTSIETICDSCKFLANPDEKEKIMKARDLILKNLDQPFTIPELSQQLGINQCYLKKGFKEIYGSTIYDFVQVQRMMKAKMLLHTNKYSVSQVAEQVGFSSQSSFSNAFKRITGVYPSELPAS